jgi:hypothetical protein
MNAPSTAPLAHYDGALLAPGSRFFAPPDPSIGPLRSAATNEGAGGVALVAGSGARVASWTILGTLIGGGLCGGFGVLVISIFPTRLLPIAPDVLLLAAAALGAVTGGFAGFSLRRRLDRATREISYVGEHGVHRATRNGLTVESTVMRFADVIEIKARRSSE